MAYIWMLCSALSFATMGALVHALREDASWEVIACARSIVVLVLAIGIVYISGVQPRFRGPWQLWVRSVAGSTSMLFVFYSFTQLPVSIVITLMNLAPLWVAIASWFLYPKMRSRGVWVAVGVGIIGVVLIEQPQLARRNLAVLAPLVASVLLAVVMMALHQAKSIDSRAVVLHFAMTAFVTSSLVFLFLDAGSTLNLPVHGSTLTMLFATGIAATFGQLFLTVAFASGPPNKVSVVGLTQVGMAMVYDIGISGHDFNILSLVGILLVVAPTAWLLYVDAHQLVEE